MTHTEKAAELFQQGYNCAQAVFLAFNDVMQLPDLLAAKMASSFGGGMGRMREVCGSVSGMLLAAGVLYGYDDPVDRQAKIDHYARVRGLAESFQEKNGSIICRELLKNCRTTPGGVPQERNDAFYQSRPCLRMVTDAATILEEYLTQNPLEEVRTDGNAL